MHTQKSKLQKILRAASKTVAGLTLFVLVFSPFASVLQAVPVAHAETAGDSCSVSVSLNSGVATPGITDTGKLVPSPAGGFGCQTSTTTYYPSNSGVGQTVTIQDTQKPGAPTTVTKGTDPGDICNSFASCLANIVYVFTVGIMSIFAYIGSYVFDIAVQLTLNSTAYALSFLTTGWTAVRDVANLAFIFILIYLAFTIIFQAETHGAMKTLAAVIIMALLVNFSFFITRVVIDAGNILSVEFYNAIQAPPLSQTAAGSTLAGATTYAPLIPALNGDTKDLTASIMGAVQVQNLLSSKSFQQFQTENGGLKGFGIELITLSLIYVMVGAVLAILAFAFLTVGFKFIMRLIVLWFVIISAPLAFAARAFANNKKALGFYHQWQDLLFKFAFYPAIFLFMFLIINFVLKGLSVCAPGTAAADCGLIPSVFSDLASVSSNNGYSFSMILGAAIANVVIRLGLVVLMLYYALKVADFIVTEGTSMARGASNWVGRRLGGLTYGTLGAVGRNTIGAGAQAAYESNRLRNFAANNRIIGGTLWRGAGALSKKNFDARGIPGLREGVKTLGGLHGGDIGEPSGKGGYSAAFDARVKKREEEAKKFKPSQTKLDEAYTKAVAGLNEEDRKALNDKAAAYAEAQEDQKEGRGTTADVKKAFDDLKKLQNAKGENIYKKIIDEAKKEAGNSNDKAYAESISKKSSWKNLWGATGHPRLPVPGLYVSAADKEAAAKIRAPKNDAERLKNILKELGSSGTAKKSSPLTRQAMDTGSQYGSLNERTDKLQAAIQERARGMAPKEGAAPHAEGKGTADEQKNYFVKSLREQRGIRKAVEKLATAVRQPQQGVDTHQLARELNRGLGNKLANIAQQPTPQIQTPQLQPRQTPPPAPPVTAIPTAPSAPPRPIPPVPPVRPNIPPPEPPAPPTPPMPPMPPTPPLPKNN